MDRRTFIHTAAVSLCAGPLIAYGKDARQVPVVGFLTSFGVSSLAGLREGLRDLGYVEGKNITLEQRTARGKPEVLPSLAMELVRLDVDVIYATGPPAIKAARDATREIPIVALDLETDPVQRGWVQSLSRPGSNITGLFLDFPDLAGKWLELLLAAAPGRNRLGVLWDSTTGSAQLSALRAAGQHFNIDLQVLEVRASDEIEDALRSGVRAGANALVALSSPIVIGSSKSIAEFATHSRLPAISPFREFADGGGLISYGPNLREFYVRAAFFVDKILRGAKAADLPIEQPTKFELVINLQAAKSLELTIPPSLLLRADEVIQ
jgi:putative tryptophan/tyrosine transport system substrate-binding protein